jgi:hypothetical protein
VKRFSCRRIEPVFLIRPVRLCSGGSRFVSVMLRVKLGRLRRMVSCVVVVALRRVSVVSCRLMVAGFVLLRRFMMILRGMFVVTRVRASRANRQGSYYEGLSSNGINCEVHSG